jgi:hypothetical protein
LCFKLVKFLLGLTATMTVVTLVTQVFTFGYFGETIGLVSMGIEAMLGIPQAYSNWSRKSVEGLSIKMIGMWFLGDFAKTCYFIIEVLFLSLSASPSSSCSAEWSNSPWTSSSSPRSSTTARPTTTKSNTSQIQLQTDPHSSNSGPALIRLSSKSIYYHHRFCLTPDNWRRACRSPSRSPRGPVDSSPRAPQSNPQHPAHCTRGTPLRSVSFRSSLARLPRILSSSFPSADFGQGGLPKSPRFG